MTEQPIWRATEAFVTIANLCDELHNNLDESKRKRAAALIVFAQAAGLEGIALGAESPLTREIARAMKRVAEEAYRTGLERGRANAQPHTDPLCGIKYLKGAEEFACNLPADHAGGHFFQRGSI